MVVRERTRHADEGFVLPGDDADSVARDRRRAQSRAAANSRGVRHFTELVERERLRNRAKHGLLHPPSSGVTVDCFSADPNQKAVVVITKCYSGLAVDALRRDAEVIVE